MSLARTLTLSLVASSLVLGVTTPNVAEAFSTVDIIGPVGSERFGQYVDVLPNGNIVVSDPYYDSPAAQNVGAVRLYDGTTLQLISTLQGSHADDAVSGPVTVVGTSNFVVANPNWDNVSLLNAGAVTFVNGTTGLNGEVSAANSIVGSHALDQVGYGLSVLTNGNFVVNDAFWDNGGAVDAGFAMLVSGTSGATGVPDVSNSLVGTITGDHVGSFVTVLTNGNYVTHSPDWQNGTEAAAGSVTWGSGTSGVVGAVSSSNSLVGITANDRVGNNVEPLANGNYVVGSPLWNFGTVVDVGAATWMSGSTPSSGTITFGNSITGAFAGDRTGILITALTNGNYVVGSTFANTASLVDAGAATWGNGATGTSGLLTGLDSIRGSGSGNGVGSNIRALTNGNYVVGSGGWDNGLATDAGAATWASGAGATAAFVGIANSLVGSHTNDHVGEQLFALANGNYVVATAAWRAERWCRHLGQWCVLHGRAGRRR